MAAQPIGGETLSVAFNSQYIRVNVILLLLCTAAIFASCLIGSTPMPFERFVSAFVGLGIETDQMIVWEIRFPRAMTAAAVGFALGLSGAALQGLLRNPLADPGVLGVSASSALGASSVLYYGLASQFAWALPAGAIAAALAATGIIAFVATRTSSTTSLILVGVALSSFATALMSLLLNLAPNPFSLADLMNWMLGSVANRSLIDLAVSGPLIIIGLAILLPARAGLSALSLGEEAARGVGLDLRRLQIQVVTGAGLATGGAVALAGAIGFVGLVAPHLVRPWLRHDPGRSLLPAAWTAAVILVIADIAVRVIPTVQELKLGVAAALMGAPAFAWIAIQRRAHD